MGRSPADEVSDNTGQGLDRGVEVLVGGLQVQLCSVQGTDDPHKGRDVLVVRPEGKRDSVGSLVDDLLCAVPVQRHPSY